MRPWVISPPPSAVGLISVRSFRHNPIIFKYFRYNDRWTNFKFGHPTNGFRTADGGIVLWIGKLLNKIIIPRVGPIILTWIFSFHFISQNARASTGLRPLHPHEGLCPFKPRWGFHLQTPHKPYHFKILSYGPAMDVKSCYTLLWFYADFIFIKLEVQ